jgi:hypothetical protein
MGREGEFLLHASEPRPDSGQGGRLPNDCPYTMRLVKILAGVAWCRLRWLPADALAETVAPKNEQWAVEPAVKVLDGFVQAPFPATPPHGRQWVVDAPRPMLFLERLQDKFHVRCGLPEAFHDAAIEAACEMIDPTAAEACWPRLLPWRPGRE